MHRNRLMDMDSEGNDPAQDAIDAEAGTSSDSGDELESWHTCDDGSDSDFKESNDICGGLHESGNINTFTAESIW